MRFDVCAHTYDEHAGPQRFFAERVAQFALEGGAVIPSVSSWRSTEPPGRGDRTLGILELGAGTGALTQWLLGVLDADGAGAVGGGFEAAPSFLATDASPTMVERGRLAVPQAEWSVLDAFSQRLPVAVLQVSSGLLHWADDPVSMLGRWKSAVAPGGRMVHAMPCEPCLAEWRELVPESPVPWRSQAEWLGIFGHAGLRVTRSQVWTHAAVSASALEMVRGFHRTGVTGRVRVGTARLRGALRDYESRHRLPGGVTSTWAWLAVEAM